MLLLPLVLWTATQLDLKKTAWIDPLRDDLVQRAVVFQGEERIVSFEARTEFSERISSTNFISTSSSETDLGSNTGSVSSSKKITVTSWNGSRRPKKIDPKDVVVSEQKWSFGPVPLWAMQQAVCYSVEISSLVKEVVLDRFGFSTRSLSPRLNTGWRGAVGSVYGFYDPARDYVLLPRSSETHSQFWVSKPRIDVQSLEPVANEVIRRCQKSGAIGVYGVNHITELDALSEESKSRVLKAYESILNGEDRKENKSPLKVRVLVFKHVRITDHSGAQLTFRVPGSETRGGPGEAPTPDLTELAQGLSNLTDVPIKSLTDEQRLALNALIASGEVIWCGAKVMKAVPMHSELEQCSLTVTDDASVSIRYDTRSFTYPVSLSPKPVK